MLASYRILWICQYRSPACTQVLKGYEAIDIDAVHVALLSSYCKVLAHVHRGSAIIIFPAANIEL